MFSIPIFDDLLDSIVRSSVFFKIDLHSEYHEICIREGDKQKTVFKIKDGVRVDSYAIRFV